MKLYSKLSKIPFLKNRYVAKFLFVAFLGIHIPLIGLVFFVVYLEHQLSPMNVFLITLVLTLLATAVTLIILKQLMAPVLKGSKALLDYRNNQTVPRLPLEFTDEAGIMLQNIQSTIQANQKLLVEKKSLFQMLTNDLRKQTENTSVLINTIYNETEKEDIKKLASFALKSMNQQIHSVESFIELLKQEAVINGEQVKVRKINLVSVLNEVKRNFESNLKNKNLELIYNIHVTESQFKVNLKLLHQMFQYLFENAIKYSPDNAKIEITIEKNNGRLMIFVRDYGIGFEAGQAEKIFTKFNSKIGNLEDYSPGIGLYLTRQIVERFGGTIVAESGGLNKGATFSIELKIYR